MDTLLEKRPASRRPGRRKPMEQEKNAVYGLRMLCKMTQNTLALLIGCKQSHIWRVEHDGNGLGTHYWVRMEEVFGESRYELRDPELPARIELDCARLARMRARVNQKMALLPAEYAKKNLPRKIPK